MADRTSELYEIVSKKGLLADGMTEDMFREQTKTDEGLRSFYDYAKEHGMRVSDWDTFRDKTRGVITAAPTDNRETTERQPAQQAGVSGGSLLNEQEELARQNAILGVTNDQNQPFVGQSAQEKQPNVWQTFYKGLGAGAINTANSLLGFLNRANSAQIANDPMTLQMMAKQGKSPEEIAQAADATRARLDKAENERYEAWKKKADQLSAEAKPDGGEKSFTDYLSEGKIGKALQLGLGTAAESLPYTVSALNPVATASMIMSMSEQNYRQSLIDNPNMSEGKRLASAAGNAAIEMAVEHIGNPFKVFKAGKLTAPNATKWIKQVVKESKDNIYKGILRVLGFGAKEAGKEGVEELATTTGQDLYNTLLDWKDTNGLGLRSQWERAKQNNPNLTPGQFALDKAEGLTNDFIGGALSGMMMSGPSTGVGIVQNAKYYSKNGGSKASRTQAQQQLAVLKQLSDEFGVPQEQVAQAIVDYQAEKQLTPNQQAIINRGEELLTAIQQSEQAAQEVEQVQQDRQTQLRQQASQQAQQEVQGMAHQDGNVYYVGIKGNEDAEGYAVSGALGMVTDNDGIYSTSGRDLVTVKMNDGSVQQVPADELIVRDIPVSADELMQERTEHYFAQYANNDLFHVGDKVYIKQDGQQSEESSNITAIDDAGIHVEVYDEQTGQTGEMVIPHEQAAEALAVAQDEQIPNNQLLQEWYEEYQSDKVEFPHAFNYNSFGEYLQSRLDNVLELSKEDDAYDAGYYERQIARISQALEYLNNAGTQDSEQPAQEQVVNFTIDGNPLQLYQVGEDIYEERTPDGKTYRYTSADLANMGAIRQTEVLGISQIEGSGSSQIEEQAPAYPTDETGNPAWGQMEVPQSAQVLYNLYKGNRESAKAYADDQLKEAQKIQKAAAKQASHNLNLAQRLAEEEQNAQFKAQADAAVKYWEDVKLAIAQIKTADELAAEQAQRDKLMAARDQNSKTEEGTTANATMAERYNAAPKIVGNAGTTTLPDGRELAGHYVLIAPEGVTASHNAADNFRRSVGYPITADGQSINDRDYTADQEEQQKVTSIAQNFNGNAIKNMPVISDEGLVYNGNGRMMAGQLAAINGTDAAYMQSLMNNATQYGFTPEQVASIPNARVVFQLDERLPYSTQSLAIFNEQETQTQSNTGKAAGYARKLTPQAVSDVLSAVDGFNTIDAFFSDKKAPFNLINSLINAGIIAQREKAEMIDGDKLSATGRERLANILFGTVFDNETIRLMGDDAALKNSIMRALPQILDNKSLGEFSLESDINDAIRLLYEVRRAGVPFQSFVRQTVMSEDGEVHTAAENYSPYQLLLAEEMIDGGVDAFRDVLNLYNEQANTIQGGQVDIFGNLLDPTELKNLILQRYDKEPNETERPSAGRQNDNAPASAPASNEPAAEVTKYPQLIFAKNYYKDKGAREVAHGIKEDDLDSIFEAADEMYEALKPYVNDMVNGGGITFIPVPSRKGKADTTFKLASLVSQRITNKTPKWRDGTVTFENILQGNERESLYELKKAGRSIPDGDFFGYRLTGELPQKGTIILVDGVYATGATMDAARKAVGGDVISLVYAYDDTKAAEVTPEERLAKAEAETDANPTEAQKKAENYKQGHVTLWGLPITIENPKGSIRRGTDANGKQWEQEMHHTYGKIRRTEGVDGDHIDVFIGPNLYSDKVFVVDQRNVDTGEFDEHKCMLGFDSLEDAQNGYLSNYEEGWQGMGTVTEVTMDEFKKWIDSSHRKTKPFAEYKSVKAEGAASTAINSGEQLRDELAVELRKLDYEEPSPIDANVLYDIDDLRNAVTEILTRYSNPALQSAIDAINNALAEQRARGVEWVDVEKEKDALVQIIRDIVGDKAAPIPTTPKVSVGTTPLTRMSKDEILNELQRYAAGNLLDMSPRIAKRIISLAKKYGKGLPEEFENMASNAKYMTDLVNRKVNVQTPSTPTNNRETTETQATEKQLSPFEQFNLEHKDDYHIGDKVAFYVQGRVHNGELISFNEENNSFGVREWFSKRENKYTDYITYPTQIKRIIKKAELKPSQNRVKTDSQPTVEANVTATPVQEQPKEEPKNTIFTDEAYEKAKARMKARLNRLNMGIDPEMVADQIVIAGYHVERGARKFADFARALIADFGDGIRQYARQMYNYLRDIPEGEPFRGEMDDYATVMAFDIDNFDFKDRMMPAVREYEDVNGQKIVIDDVVKGRDGTVYYELTITEPSGHARQTTIPIDDFNKELESKGIFPAKSEKNERKNAENEQNILINQNNLVTLQPNEKEYAADGLSVVVNTQDYTTYLTPQAKEVFARLGQKERKAHKRPELSYISFASRDGVMIPLDVLKSDPAIVDAQAKIDSNSGSLELTQEQIEEYANRLLEGGDIKSERKAFIIIGRPAGGKSSVFAEPLAEQNSARIIDSDEVKPWLDGYDNGDGAGYVQKASDLVMQEALWRAVLNGDNVVIPKIGGGSIIDEITLPLKELGYTVELYYNEVAPESSYMRAMARFAEKGRYLSLNYLAGIGDKPTKTFNNYSTKDIYGTISELSSQKVQDLRARLARIREMETQLLPERLGQGGRSISTLGISELLESGELGRGRDSQLTGTPLFDHYEWKNNDVPFGTKPKTIKQGDNINSNNDNGNAERTVPETSATETAPTGTNQEGAQDAGEASGLGGNRPADRSGLPNPQSSQFEQEAELERQAKANGTWLDFEEIYKSAARALPVGKEADVYLSQDGKHVIKVINYSKYSQTPYDFLRDRVELFNLLFPETAYRLLGYTRNADGQFCPVVEQPFIEGHLLEDYWLATKGKVKYSELEPMLERYMLEKHGMHKYGLDAYEDELYRVQDLHLKNVRIDDDGNLYVIDAVPSYRKTNDGGGKKTTYEKGQKVKYKNKVDGKLYDATIDSVNADGTYNLLAPNPVFGDVFMGNISEDRISPIEQQKEEKPVSPMKKQFQSIKEQYPDATLMFRVGDFYELYEEDAVEASKILGINLVKHKDGHTFAGFPFHALDTYLPKLVRAGKRVAICDQLEDPNKAKGLVKRGVSELVTPGTPYQEPAPETQPEPQQVVTDTVGEITESKHTKTGNPIWIVKPLERVGDAEFRALRKRAKENNGYYSTFVKGYVFNSVNDANLFNNISDVQTTTEQGRADSEAAISTAETASAEAAAIRRDSGDTSGAAGELGGESVETGVSGSRDVELTPEQAAEQTQERKDAIQKIDEATEHIDKQLAELTDQVEEKTPEEEPAPTSMSEVVEQAKKRQQKAKQRKQKLEQTLNLFAEAENSTPAIAEQTEPINNEDNGSTEVRNDGERESSAPQGRTAGQPSDQNGTLGGSQRQANEGTQSGRVGSRSEQHRVHDGERGLGTAGQRSTESVEEPVAESERKNTHNFRYNPADPAPTSNRARYEANLAAIRLLKQLQNEDRQATPEEQRVLAKFTGWGGLGEFFKGEPGTTYWSDHGEKSPYQVIKELLTDEEMQAAQLSRNSAYFTPPAIIDELWSIAQHLGFKGGNILEGSAGIGNILSQMPQSISDRSNLQAVEIDSITAGILAQLYPDAQVHAAGFQEVDIPNNSQDLVITNVPFVTGLRVYDKKEKDLSKRFGNIHDFCIAKNIRKLRQGGIGIFITTSGTLDNSKDLRRWLNNEGETDVIGAFRLNRETFGGTSATSDIIVVRKRVNGQKDPRAIDVLDTDVARVAETEEDGKNIEKKLIYNRYFVEHPESMGGEMGFGFEHGDTRWGGTTSGCYPSPAINQSERLQEWVEAIPTTGEVQTVTVRESDNINPGTYEEYHGDLPYGSLVLNSKDEICRVYNGMVVSKGDIFRVYNGMMVPVEGINPTKVKGHTKAEVLKDYNTLKAAVEELLAEQAKGISDEGLKGLLKKLNRAYDDFVKKYGNLNRNVSLSFLRNDVQWASMAALENVRETIDKSGKKHIDVSKTDVFSKRVVGVQAEPKAENARDGVILSVQQYGNVRPDMIAMWLERPQEEVEKEIIESRLAFRDPQTGNMVVSHEYLSGNVREKLAYAEEHNENGIYDTNIEELRKVIPVDIPAHLIEFNIGSTWIPVELYHQYLKEKFGVDNLQLVHIGSAWISNEKSYGGYALRNEKNRAEGVYSEKLMEQVYGHQLMIAAMNNVPVVVSKTEKHRDGTTETITDKAATAACSDKISQIKDDFVEWARGKMQEDSELAERVQKIYNERFNAIVPMLSVDKAFLSPHLPGQNHKYTLYDHQQQAVVRATTQPVMLAHEVGTGKTITLISSAMEMRRLGTAKKPMIVVQNATTPQFVKEAKDLYPNAKILTVSERDRTKEGRQEFYAKNKYNDWDLIIVPQSVFDMIPDSESRMRDFIQEKIDEKMHAIEAAKEANVDAKVTKRMEKELEALQEDLQNANMSGKRSKSKTEKDAKKDAERIENAKARAEEMLDRRTDEVEDFDDMGIDALLIDEAHNYKHLGFATMMTRGVKGIDPSYSKRAAALYLKCQSVYERCGHRNVVFATGTPISNTAAEIWTFMKYLMPKEVLKDNDIYYFDDFVHNFGKIAEQLEFATNGKFKANNRFAQYGNVPELMRIWLTCADCVLTREVGQVNDKVPELEGGKAQDIFLPQSPSLIDIMASVRAELERYEQMSGKEKKENSHIPLTMYGVAKRAAIDPRLVDASAADEPLSKTNKAVEETLRSLKETKKYNGTVAIFCDSYRNLQTGFNLFEDIKAKLVKAGVPAAKIAIIRSEMTDAAKQKIFDAVREGEIRVIMGSTQTLGTGVNIQTRLHTLIHMDAPDRPMDYTQRNGRIIRQGNMHRQWNLPVRVLRFGVEDSLDVTSYQRLKTKAGFIDSIMNGKSMIDNNLENRVLEDVEEGIFDNPVAMLSGSQYALLKSQAERDLRKWQARKQQHDIDQILIAKKLKDNAQIIEHRRQLIATDEQFLQTLKQTFPTGKVTEYNIDGTICHNAAELKEALKAINAEIQARADKLRKEGYEGSKQNIAVSLQFNGMPFNVNIVLIYNSRWESGQRAITINKEVQYTTPTSDHWLGSPTKVLDKLVEHIEQDYLSGTQATGEINYSRSYIERLQQENELMRQREGKPFEHGAELEKAQALVNEYTEKMQDELAEKEAKYANMSSGRTVTLNEQDDEEETPEAQITNLDYPQFANQTEAQQLATAALVEVLNDNTDLDVFLATDEEASQIMGDDNVEFSIRREPAPKKTGIGYKVFYRGKDGKLYPPMVANPNGEATPVGVWLNADAAPVAGESKTGRPQVKAGGKGTQGGSGQLAYRPGWHLGEIPYALQFNRKDENGEKTLFPKDFVWAEVEYAADNDYQEEAMREGMNASGKFQHSLAGLKHVPTDGFYRYRTNPNPATDPWIITGAMKVNRVLTNEEVDDIVRAAGREPQVREAMLTPNGTLYGWAIGDKIYLTKAGLNPNTPIHEYTHLWAKAMMRNNREGWQSIVDIFKDTEFWNEVVNDPNYQGLTTDNAICSEVLARYSGQRGAAHMEQWAQEELAEADYNDDLLRGAKVRRLIKRAKQAIEDFWRWVGTNLFGIKHFDSAEQVADRVLYDMLNQTELGDLSGNINAEMMISGYTPEKQRIVNEWYDSHPYPQYQLGETFDHYTARLDAWKEEFKAFQAQLEESRPSINAATKKSNRSTSAGASFFVPGVRPTPLADETPGEYALRLRQYYQLMRDERLVAEYVAEINNQADAAAKVLKKNTIVRGLLDAAKPIENFQEWMKQHGATITDESNAYTDTFLATGRVTEANEQMQRDIIRPLAKQIAKIIAPDAKTGKSRLDGINIVWHNMDIAGTGTKLDGKALTPREIIGVYCQAKDCAEAIEKGLPDRGAKGFLNNLGMSHDDIITAVESVIPRAELDELWRLINAATHFALNYDYESGRISEDTHTEFYQREFYVPQRGWRERDESGLITDYEPVGKRGNDPYNAALVKAHGRQSLASDPFAYIMSIDASSIVSSENNKIKQKFLQFCLDNENLGLQTGAFRVKKYWIMNVINPDTGKIKLDEEGNPMMEVSYVAPTAEDLSHDRTIKELIKKKRKEWAKVNQAYLERQSHGELGPQLEAAYKTKLNKIEQAIEDLEQQMHIAWNATNTNITQRTSDEKKQHEVRVLLDGQEYLIEVQDEKLANAINKKFKQHQEQLFNTSQKMRNATRFMSAVLTQYNPEFAVSNFARDFQVALATLTAEHPELVGPFLKNFAACQPAVWQYAFNDKVRGRAVFRDSELGHYLQEYLKAGAATGFSYMQDLKTLRQDFDAMINESNLRRGIKGAVGTLSMLTQVSETAVRFTGYVAARQKGMGINEAAYLSKELTTNFDRAGEVADSGWMSWFSFFRATLNGNIKFLKALKKMPVAYSIIAAAYVAMGMLNQFLNPDDPEDEVWAGDFTRESNFVIGKWRIPTAHFLRMFFAAGVNTAKWMQGEKSFGEATYNTATFASNELLPDYLNLLGNATEWNSREGKVDFTWEGLLQGVMPSPVSPIADVYFNRDFRGATINREPFVKSQEGTKDILLSKENTLPVYKWLTQAIYEGVGGNMNAKYQSDDPAWRSWLFDTSASSVEHVVEGYMPAGMDMFITLGEAIYDAATGTPTGPSKWPFVRKFYNAYTPERAYMQQYYLLNGRVKEFKRNMNDYKKNDPQKYRRVQNSQEYRIYQAAERLVKNQIENPTTADVKALINANKQWIKYQ